LSLIAIGISLLSSLFSPSSYYCSIKFSVSYSCDHGQVDGLVDSKFEGSSQIEFTVKLVVRLNYAHYLSFDDDAVRVFVAAPKGELVGLLQEVMLHAQGNIGFIVDFVEDSGPELLEFELGSFAGRSNWTKDLLEEEDLGVVCMVPEGGVVNGEGLGGEGEFEADTSSDFSIGLVKENADGLGLEVLLVSPVQGSLEVVFIFCPERAGLAFELVEDVVCIDLELCGQIFDMFLKIQTKDWAGTSRLKTEPILIAPSVAIVFLARTKLSV
jgi:hypothetical protein